ncbi:hypothetical protein CEXT_105611 [Caerostris extrusa]|uniref:Uncharacterized protein n=1 Tax=Caerostris extrusa TaxID=172846 RepID=A0AAV4Q024_CAEEX|nr:hypothetical protein CEXT_105611 [Caerostris extrusa]
MECICRSGRVSEVFNQCLREDSDDKLVANDFKLVILINVIWFEALDNWHQAAPFEDEAKSQIQSGAKPQGALQGVADGLETPSHPLN